MLANPGNERVELFLFGGVVKRGGSQEWVVQLCPQTVAGRHIQFPLSAPDEIPAAFGHLPGGGACRVARSRSDLVGTQLDVRLSTNPSAISSTECWNAWAR